MAPLEEHVQKPSELLQLVLDNVDDLVAVADLEGRRLYTNQSYKRVFGNRELLRGTDIFQDIHPDDRERIKQLFQEIGRTGIAEKAEYRFLLDDGNICYIESRASAIHDASGKPDIIVIVSRDVSERKQAEEALQRSEQHFRSFFEHSSDVIVMTNEDCAILHGSPSIERMLGFRPEEYVGKSFLSFLHPDDLPQVVRTLQSAREQPGTVYSVEHRLQHKLGIWRMFESISKTVIGMKGDKRFIINSRDITERNRAETFLRETNYTLHSLIRTSPLAIVTVNLDRKVKTWNNAAERIFGWSEREVLGRPLPITLREHPAALHAVFEHESSTLAERGVDIRTQRKDGTFIDVNLWTTPLRDAEGTIIGSIAIYADITERKRTENQVRESEERFRSLVETTSDWIWEVDSNGVYTYASPGVHDLLGYDPTDVIGKRPFDFMDPDDAKRFQGLLSGIVEQRQAFYGIENNSRHKDGRFLIIETSGVPTIDPNGTLRGYRGIDRDVTQRRQAEVEIARQKEYLQRILDSSTDLIFTVRADGTLAYANDRLSEILGYGSKDIHARHFLEFITEEDRPAVRQKWEELQGGVSGIYETRLRRADGSVVDCLVSHSPIKGSNEYLAILKNITPLKRAEAELTLQKSYFQQLFENSPEAIAILDNADGVLDANRSFAALFQYTREETKGMRLNDIIVPHHLSDEAIGLSRQVLAGGVVQCETVRKRKDGSLVDVSVVGFPIMLGGNQIGVYGIYTDITQRKLAEKERDRLSLAVEQAAEAIVVTDPAGVILYVNPAFQQITGYGREEVLGNRPNMLKSGKHEKDFYQQMWSTLLRGEVWSGHITNKRKDGSLYEEEMVISPVRDDSGKIINYVAVKRDVTRELEIEHQLRQSQKMESLGQLAGGIAHDFNNILGVIGGSLSFLKAKKIDPELHRYIDMGETAVQRGTDVAKRLLTFSREDQVSLTPLSLRDIVNELAKVLESTIEKTVVITTDIPHGLPMVRGDHGQLYQVLLNLCINARDAILDPRSEMTSGRITIVASTIQGNTIHDNVPEASDEQYVRLSVRDTGAGMTEEVRQRIFDPFFTTKPRGKGTGLGLAVVYGIVKNHRGWIEVESEPGHGSAFHVYLPAYTQALQVIEKPKEEAIIGGSETILVVEDEAALRTLLVELLQMHGYTVVSATDGLDALEKYKALQHSIDAVISDMGLPKMSGEELVLRVKQLNPTARLIIASGYLEPHQKSKLFMAGVKAFIQKPYRGTSILKTLREILETTA